MQPDQILAFWFEHIDRKLWWATDPDFDARIQAAYGGVLEQAAAGEWSAWRIDARGRLAEIIVLDQFSRNIFRGSPRAFAQDPIALVLAQEANPTTQAARVGAWEPGGRANLRVGACAHARAHACAR